MNKPTISYCITVNDEYKELRKVFQVLNQNKRPEDEIVIQQDNTSNGVSSDLTKGMISGYCGQLQDDGFITFVQTPLNKDFATFKNNLRSVATKDYIFQIDADECPSEYLITYLPDILEMNPGIDLVWVPRINTVDGLTQEDIDKWRWNVSEDGYVNFPDYQSRIYRRDENIVWKSKVHEQITGVQSFANLPMTDDHCLYHPKTIDKQRKQNNFYNTL